MSGGERVGVFGGTFDPPHIGHFWAAVNTFEALSLHRVLLVVSNSPWQKVGRRQVSPAEHRLAMVAAGVEGHAGLEASDVEIRLGGESSSVRTLRRLRADRPDDELFLIVGADAAAGIPTWRESDQLPGLASLVIVERPGSVVDDSFWRGTCIHVACHPIDVSSSDLRARVTSGRRIDFLVPDPVAQIVGRAGLYR